MARGYGRACLRCLPAQRSCRTPLSSRELLLAVHALQQRRVTVYLRANGLAVTEGEYVGVSAGPPADTSVMATTVSPSAIRRLSFTVSPFSANRPNCSMTSVCRGKSR